MSDIGCTPKFLKKIGVLDFRGCYKSPFKRTIVKKFYNGFVGLNLIWVSKVANKIVWRKANVVNGVFSPLFAYLMVVCWVD